MTPEQSVFKEAVTQALIKEGATDLILNEIGNKAEWHFKLERNNQIWQFYLPVYNWNLTPLPYLHWETDKPVWGWPHTGGDGSICAFDRQGLNYDAEDYEGIIQAIISKSMEILNGNHAITISQRLRVFADELESYARNVGISPLTLDAPLGKNQRIHADVFQKEKNQWEIDRINSPQANRKAQRHSLFVLDLDVEAIPPLINKPDADWWQKLRQNLSDKSRCRLDNKRGCGVVLRISNRFGGAHILLYWGNNVRGQQFQIYRLEPIYHEYLTRRVGQRSLERKIAIVGVGAVGSRVAEHLAQTGVKHLTLVDSDKMSANNLGRHVLSRYYIGKNKAESLAVHLSSRMPGVEITPYASTVEAWLNHVQPNNFDVIVLATGDIAGERLLLRRAWREGWTCKLICTFVEAANLGGHAISMQPGEQGCLECLCEIDTTTSTEKLRTIMLTPEQSPLQEISGCGAFTPYSAISATRTALLATELSFPNADIGYHRWAGNDNDAIELNLHPSEFWKALRNGNALPFVTRNKYIRGDCKCCSS